MISHVIFLYVDYEERLGSKLLFVACWYWEFREFFLYSEKWEDREKGKRSKDLRKEISIFNYLYT